MGSNMQAQASAEPDVVFDFEIPDEILLEVFLRVPDRDLASKVLLVCHKWRNLADSAVVWKRKCVNTRRFIPGLMPEPDSWKIFYFKNPFTRNFIKNPCGDDDKAGWQTIGSGEYGMLTEDYPGNGAKPCQDLEDLGVKRCFATSYRWGSKQQLIDLVGEGCPARVLDELKPPILIEDWVGSRWDCGSVYKLQVNLLDAAKKNLETYDPEEMFVAQWNDATWKKVQHVFKGYPTGVRYVLFAHKGKDTQFWAGHYGAKMTASCVRFLFVDDNK